MLAIGILAMLMGVMMALVEKSLEASITLEQEQQRLQQRYGILDLLRTTFRTLPNDAQFISRRVSDSSTTTQQQLVFANAPTVLAWGNPDEMLHSGIILGSPAKIGGGLNLSIKRIPPPDIDLTGRIGIVNFIGLLPVENSSDDTSVWLPLLADVKSVQWRFLDPRSLTWLDDWTDAGTRPTLVELRLQYLDETTDQRYVFWVPPVVPNALVQIQAAAADGNTRRPTNNNAPPGGTTP